MQAWARFLTTHATKRGPVMKGNPLTGEQIVTLSGTGPAGFQLKAAPTSPVKTPGPTGFGLRRTTSGEFNNIFPYIYSYTYATLRNSTGNFFAGSGLGNFAKTYMQGGVNLAKIKVAAGSKKFGGVMRLLGQLTTKVCYFRNGGCSLGENDWRYDAVGTSAYTAGGVVTKGYVAPYTAIRTRAFSGSASVNAAPSRAPDVPPNASSTGNGSSGTPTGIVPAVTITDVGVCATVSALPTG